MAGPTAASVGGGSGGQGAGLLALVAAVNRASAQTLVVGGRADSGPGGLISAVRATAQLAGAVSTVDATDSAAGRVGTVLALVVQQHGQVGQYGDGPGANAPLLAPTGRA